MLQIAWWDWPPQRIEATLPALMAGDTEALALAR
jgi:hypothetical protein